MVERSQYARRPLGDTTVPDIDTLISEWRQQMNCGASLERRELDELEDHLRASCESIRELGLSTDEAFVVAKHRLGYSDVLSVEFAKVNSHRGWRHLATSILVLPTIVLFSWVVYEEPYSLNPWHQAQLFETPSWFVLPPLITSIAIFVNSLIGALRNCYQRV